MPRLLRALLAAAVLLVAVATPAPAAIVINEIMYNTPGTPDVEYVELYNTGPLSQNLAGWYLLDDGNDHTRCQLSGTMAVGGYLILANKISLFNGLYPGAGPVNPNAFDSDTPGVGFGLGNTNDAVRLFNPQEVLMDSVAYSSGGAWPSAADGDGPSLELRNPGLDNALSTSWAASIDPPPRGTPGQQNSVYQADPPPLVGGVTRNPPLPGPTDTVIVTAAASDQQGIVSVDLWVDLGSGYQAQPMLDDGLHGDGPAGNGVWGTSIAPQLANHVVRYYLVATDTLSQSVTAPANAPAGFFAYTVGHVLPDLEIGEILAANTVGLTDSFGDHDDWLEIRNRGPATVNLGGMFLGDSLTDTQVWQLPSFVLGPGQRLLVWCDLEPQQGAFHAVFKLSKEGGEVGLYESVAHGNVLIHGFTFGPQSDDVSFGYWPNDADAPEYLVPPTPGASNAVAGPYSPVVINEFLAGSQIPGLLDWVELYNRSGATADIGGWSLSDGSLSDTYFFPSPTLIPPGGFLSLDQNQLGFALSLDGSDVLELVTDSGGAASSGRDYFDLGPQSQDVSQGRFPDGTANWHFFSPATREQPNDCDLGVEPLAPVTGLRFATRTAISWDAIPQAAAYDIVHGDLAVLRAGGSFTTALGGCLENNGNDPEGWAGETPPSGGGRFYLVRGVNFSCRLGTYDSGGAGQAAPRDPAIAASPLSCP